MKIIVEGIGEKRLDGRMFVAKGGEGSIYVSQGVAYKICENGKTIPQSKIQELSALTDDRIIKPERLIFDEAKKVPIGYTMRAVKAPWTPCHLFPRDFMRDHQLSHADILTWCQKLMEIVHHAHENHMLLVDLNELNFLLDQGGKLFAIDVNSWQTPSFPATAIMDSVRDRQTAGFSEGSDWFSWGIVTFQMLIGMHPYKGQHPDYKGTAIERMDARMKANVSVFHNHARPMAACDPLDVIPRGLRDWYRATFESTVRESPPQKFEQVAVARAKTRTVVSAGDLLVEEVMLCSAEIVRVTSFGDKMAVTLADGSVNLDGRKVNLSVPHAHFHVDPARGWMAVTEHPDGSHRELKPMSEMFGRDISQYENVFVAACGGLFGVLCGKLMLIGPIGDSHVANVLDVPAAVFQDDGFLMQNLLGRWHLVFQRSIRESICVPIPQLDGFRPVKGRMHGRMLVVSGEKAGSMVRFEFQFDELGGYDVQEFSGVSGPDFTFAVNEAGICVLIDCDDEVSAFKTGRGKQNRRVMAGSSLDASFRIWSSGVRIMASHGNVLYRVSNRPKP